VIRIESVKPDYERSKSECEGRGKNDESYSVRLGDWIKTHFPICERRKLQVGVGVNETS